MRSVYPPCNPIPAPSLTDRNFLQVVPAQVERLECRQVSDLNWQVRDLVAGGVEFLERRHPANLLRKAHQPVVVQDEALEALKLAYRGRNVAQLISTVNGKARLTYYSLWVC